MKEEINKSINDFSKGNKDLAKILALFAAQMINIFGKSITRKLSDEMLEINEGLINYYDIHI